MSDAAPDVYLCGVAKAGTTALARFLGQHPQIFVPAKKEPNYWAFLDEAPNDTGPADPVTIHFLLHRFSVFSAAEYRALYEPAPRGALTVDASVRYLYFANAIDRIAAARRDARFIVVLRDRAQRIASHWRMNRRFQLEPLPLAAAVEREGERRAAGWGWDWHYVAVSTYAGQLARLVERFGREQVHVVFHADLVRDPMGVVRSCCTFLGVDDDAVVDVSGREKVASEPRVPLIARGLERPTVVRRAIRRLPSRASDRLLRAAERWNQRPTAPVDLTVLAGLDPVFHADDVATAAVLGSDLDELTARLRPSAGGAP